jgi:ABC-type glycerol-3-phosphate transport system permease component
VKKKDGKYRLINHATEFNKYIIRNANMPLNINTFLEEFTECAIAFFIDFFSGYDHVKLDFKCKNMIIFMISLGLLR